MGTEDWRALAREVEVLTFDERAELVRSVATRREPVNIALYRRDTL